MSGILEEINSKLDLLLKKVDGNNDRYLNRNEICDRLDLSNPNSFYNYVNELYAFGLSKPKGRYLMLESDLDRYIKSKR